MVMPEEKKRKKRQELPAFSGWRFTDDIYDDDGKLLNYLAISPSGRAYFKIQFEELQSAGGLETGEAPLLKGEAARIREAENFRAVSARLFPELFEPAGGPVFQSLQPERAFADMIERDPQGFLRSLPGRGKSEDVAEFLRAIGAEDAISEAVGPPLAGFGRFIEESPIPGMDMDDLARLAKQDFDSFLGRMAEGGWSQEKDRLLREVGFSPGDIEKIIGSPPFEVGAPSGFQSGRRLRPELERALAPTAPLQIPTQRGVVTAEDIVSRAKNIAKWTQWIGIEEGQLLDPTNPVNQVKTFIAGAALLFPWDPLAAALGRVAPLARVALGKLVAGQSLSITERGAISTLRTLNRAFAGVGDTELLRVLETAPRLGPVGRQAVRKAVEEVIPEKPPSAEKIRGVTEPKVPEPIVSEWEVTFTRSGEPSQSFRMQAKTGEEARALVKKQHPEIGDLVGDVRQAPQPAVTPKLKLQAVTPAPEITAETHLNLGRAQGTRLILEEAGILDPTRSELTISEIVTKLDEIQAKLARIPTSRTGGPQFRKLDNARITLLKLVERESGLSETGLRNVAEGLPPPRIPPAIPKAEVIPAPEVTRTDAQYLVDSLKRLEKGEVLSEQELLKIRYIDPEVERGIRQAGRELAEREEVLSTLEDVMSKSDYDTYRSFLYGKTEEGKLVAQRMAEKALTKAGWLFDSQSGQWLKPKVPKSYEAMIDALRSDAEDLLDRIEIPKVAKPGMPVPAPEVIRPELSKKASFIVMSPDMSQERIDFANNIFIQEATKANEGAPLVYQKKIVDLSPPQSMARSEFASGSKTIPKGMAQDWKLEEQAQTRLDDLWAKYEAKPIPKAERGVPEVGYFTPVVKGKESLAERQSAGLPRGKFYALDKPFESPAHNVANVKRVTIPQVKNVYDPDGLLGTRSPNLGQEFADLVNQTKPADYRQAYTDFLQKKGYDSYIRGIDGAPQNRELIVFGKAGVTPAIKPTLREYVTGKDPTWREADRPSEILDRYRASYEREFGKILPEASVTPEVTIPKAERGVPEVGVKPPILPEEVAVKGVKPAGEGKAANIRLEKFPEDVRPTIKNWAEEHPVEVQEARRGVISDAAVKARAQKLIEETGGDVAKFEKEWKPGTAWNAEELVAIRGMLSQKTKAVLDAQKAVKASNSTENLLNLQLALKEHAAVQEMVHGLTAEAGRALRSFRQEVFDVVRTGETQKMEEVLRRVGGREFTEKVAELLTHIDLTDPLSVNRFIQGLYKPKIGDYITEWFYNSILSGPKTHIVNSLSNFTNAVISPIERFTSVVVDLPLAKIQARPRERFLSEVTADAFGAIKAIPDGFRQFAYVIKNGISPDAATKWEFRPRAFKGKAGAVIGFPSRMLEAADALMKMVNYRAALNAEAHRMASKAGLKGLAFEERVAQLLSNPPEALLKSADKLAEYRLFRQEPGKFGQLLMQARDVIDVKSIKPGRFVVPFLRTPINLLKYGLERTPLGLFNQGMWRNLAIKNPEGADQLARIIIGTMGVAAVTWYAKEGYITGAAPRSSAERERFYREGKQPFAIRVDGFWVSYQRLEPFNQLFSLAAILVDAVGAKDKGLDEKVLDAVNTMGQNFVSQTYMSSLSDALNMLAEPERYGTNWLNRFAGSLLVPMSAATRTATQMLDNVVRDPQNTWQTIEANIPGLSQNVQAKITALGEDVRRKSPAWFPVSVTPVEETVLSAELEKLQVNIGVVGKTIDKFELSDKEQEEYQRIAGKLIKTDLERLMLATDYWIADDTERKRMINSVISKARETARDRMKERMFQNMPAPERVDAVVATLKATDQKLGTVLSATPEFSHEPPDIYDIEHELDSSYKTLLGGIPLEALKGRDIPPTVKSWYEKEEAKGNIFTLPNKRLILLNDDLEKGDTFEDYYNQWQAYQAAEDKEKWVSDNPDYKNTYRLGNFSRRQLEALRQYHRLSGQAQVDYYNENVELLGVNPEEKWLVENPKANAQLALWGDKALLTKEAYDEFQKLVKELDIPDNLIPKRAIPDELPVFLIKTQKSFRQITAQIEAAKTLKDEKLREAEGDRLRQTKIEGDMTYKDMERKIDAINAGTREKPTDEGIIKKHIEFMRKQDEPGIGSSSAEVMLYRVDNLEYDKWRMDKEIWGDKVLKAIDRSKIPIWRIDVKMAALDKDSPEYARLNRQRDAHINGFSDIVDVYVDWYETPKAGYHDDWFLMDNKDFYDRMVGKGLLSKRDFSKVPDIKWRDEWDTMPPRKQEAIIKGIPELLLDDYVAYFEIPPKPTDYPTGFPNWEDDWWMMEHPDFYKEVYLKILGKPRKDYRKVPTREVWAKYLHYDSLDFRAEQDKYRLDNPDLDEWGVLYGIWKETMTEKRRSLSISGAERMSADIEKRLKELEEAVRSKR